MNWFLFEATSPQGWMLSIPKANKSITNFISKGGEKLGENYTFKRTLVCHHQNGGDCEEDLAPDLDTVLMKTPISQKEEMKKTNKDYQRQSFKI
ncbi:hypothetical protein Lal_00031456 [Lupinus albus]|nr:hypothetical protein Lal_00031456 [Lupinus albus]